LWIEYNQRIAGFAQRGKFSNGRPNESESYHYLEDNLAQELFEQFITDIAVDGANNKLALPILVCF
jgi:hypothetical protein